MKKENLGIVTGVKGEGQGVKNVVLQTHNLKTPAGKRIIGTNVPLIVTTRDVKGKK
jgi:hypothetical protein